jgi:hypothetical protein
MEKVEPLSIFQLQCAAQFRNLVSNLVKMMSNGEDKTNTSLREGSEQFTSRRDVKSLSSGNECMTSSSMHEILPLFTDSRRRRAGKKKKRIHNVSTSKSHIIPPPSATE